MRIFLWKKIEIIEFFLLFFSSCIAAFILQPISPDSNAYYLLFNNVEKINFSWKAESIFLGILCFAKLLKISLYLALLPFIYLTLALKLKAFKYFGLQTYYIFFCYLSLFFLMHEGIQIRIAIALGFALLACIEIVENRIFLSFLLSLISVGFHVTSILLPLVFYFNYHSKFIRKFSWFFFMLGILFYCTKISLINYLVTPYLEFFDDKYLNYTDSSRLMNQNSSGLAFYYAFSLAILIIFLNYIKKFYLFTNNILMEVNIAVCTYGIGIIFWMYETVSVGMRLSDILVIFLVPILASMINQSQYLMQFMAIIMLCVSFVLKAHYLGWSF